MNYKDRVMRKYPILFCLLFCVSAVSSAQSLSSMKTLKLLGDCVTLEAPAEFSNMSNDMLTLKYPSGARPSHVLTNERGSVNIAVKRAQDPVAPGDLAAVLEVMEKTYRSQFPNARWNRKEMVQRDGKAYFIVDLWTPAVDTEIRNVILGTSSAGRLLMVSFNVTRELESEWFSVGEAVIESVRVCD
jgi:hypothetical protein